MLAAFPLYGSYSWPVDPPTHISGTFGEYRDSHFHNGIDFSVQGERGRPVYAAGGGTVVEIFYRPQTYGLAVKIEHDDGKKSWYAHLDSIAKKISEQLSESPRPGVIINPRADIRVTAGETIGSAGDSGRGPVHLHFTLEDSQGNFINPLGFFNPRLPFEPQPLLKNVYLYPLDGKSWIEGHARPTVINGDAMEVWGRLGIEVETWNTHPGNTNRTLPREILLEVDGRPLHRLNFDTMSAARSEGPLTEVYNSQFSNITPTRYFLNLTPPGGNPGRGLKFKKPGKKGELRVVIYPGGDQPPLERKISYRVNKPYKLKNIPAQDEEIKVGRKVKTENVQLAQVQYLIPPVKNDFRDTKVNFACKWLDGRLQFDLNLEGNWQGWPKVKTLKDSRPVYTGNLIQVRPGQFKGWWAPDESFEGWHELRVVVGNKKVARRRMYIQSFQESKSRAVVDSTGRYSVYSEGRGLNYQGPVNFQIVEDFSDPRRGLQIVEPPRVLLPAQVRSTFPLTVDVTLAGDVNNPRNVLLYSWNPTAKKWEVFPDQTRMTDRHRSARIYSFQRLALLRDTSPPKINNVRRGDNGKIFITFADNQSGIAREGIELFAPGGQRLNFFWSPHKMQARVNRTQIERINKIDYLEVRVTNRAGLKTARKVAIP